MSAIKDPAQKKLLSYERDHYCRGGESDKAWRKARPVKKAKARRAYRKAANDILRACADEEAVPLAIARKREGIRQRRLHVFGVSRLRDIVADRLARRDASKGTGKQRVSANA